MRHSYRPDIPPKPQPYRTQTLDHLGLVVGMFEALGITEVIDHATQQNPEMPLVTAGQAVKAMVLNGLGFVNQQLSLVPHFFQHKPLVRLIAPGIPASHLNDDTLAWSIGFAKPSRSIRPHFQTKKANASRLRPHDGCSTPLSGCMCYTSRSKGPSGST